MDDPSQPPSLLTDPVLLWPEADRVRVVWFTAFPGRTHVVVVGDRPVGATSAGAVALEDEPGTFKATTTPLSQLFEDADSRVPGQPYDTLTPRPVWRHVAEVTGLAPGLRTPYRVVSIDVDERAAMSDMFSLAPTPPTGAGQRVLITSDHQLGAMTAANLAKAAEVAGTDLAAIFDAGDMVNIPDRASEWFDDKRGAAFFPVLQGRADVELSGRRWPGAPLLQRVPLFPTIGNHEVMGRRHAESLSDQHKSAWPRAVAAATYARTGDREVDERWLRENSFNSVTVDELFDFRPEPPTTGHYYARTFGNIRLIVLQAVTIWRSPERDGERPGKFDERLEDLDTPEAWGHGQHIFEPIDKDSAQYAWLRAELDSAETRSARYRVVMMHQPIHGVGGLTSPAFTDPVQVVDRDPGTGRIRRVRYEYPLADDYLLRDIEPLLSDFGVHLVVCGHTHIWNRFKNAAGVNFLESSNIGSTGGVCVPGHRSRDVPGPDEGYTETYVSQGDPGGLTPITPSIAPITGADGRPERFLTSDTVTAFSILDAVDGVVRSYRFDTTQPDGDVVLFDEFGLD